MDAWPSTIARWPELRNRTAPTAAAACRYARAHLSTTSEEGCQVIIVVGRVSTDAAKRADLIEVARKVASASRREVGCISYRIYEDTERANDFVFVEEWESEDALQLHFRTPHISEFMQVVRRAIVAAPDVKFHRIGSTRDLSQVAVS
jgi:quinol monooxygenase YgiN